LLLKSEKDDGAVILLSFETTLFHILSDTAGKTSKTKTLCLRSFNYQLARAKI